ncbi:hypothetical protein RJT34_12134 [Clitoria ternatea]|uniref:Uncharacterized protein n=1 Tax=Clitoria ternatea TaxID=43366 RepID=A0AAN9JNW5_CLITE
MSCRVPPPRPHVSHLPHLHPTSSSFVIASIHNDGDIRFDGLIISRDGSSLGGDYENQKCKCLVTTIAIRASESARHNHRLHYNCQNKEWIQGWREGNDDVLSFLLLLDGWLIGMLECSHIELSNYVP